MADKNQKITTTGSISFPIYYEDTDFSGFVYHANYLKFFERAREHLIGIEYLKTLYTEGLHFVVQHIDITYHKPARHGDTVEIKTECTISRSPGLEFKQTALLGETTLVSATIKAVAIGKNDRPSRIPLDVLAHFSEIN